MKTMEAAPRGMARRVSAAVVANTAALVCVVLSAAGVAALAGAACLQELSQPFAWTLAPNDAAIPRHTTQAGRPPGPGNAKHNYNYAAACAQMTPTPT